MSRQKRISDLSDPGGKIGDFLDVNALAAIDAGLGISDEKLSRMASRLNQEIHYFVKASRLLETKQAAKRRNPSANFREDIEQAARVLRDRIEKAPPQYSNHPIFLSQTDQLERFFELFAEVENDPVLSDFGSIDSDTTKLADLRISFVEDAHDIYAYFTQNSDWITDSAHKDKRFPNTFFALIKLCYSRADLNYSESQISKDITAATKA